MKRTMTLKQFVTDAMISELKDMEGQSVYGADLGYQIFESANVNGSYTCSTYEAKQWIKEYWDDLGEVVEDIASNMGAENVPNVFDKPESFQVVVMLEISSQLCGQCAIIEKHWDDKLELNKRNINTIIKQLSEIN